MFVPLSQLILKSTKFYKYFIIQTMSTNSKIYSKVAVCQMTATNNKEKNLEIIKKLVKNSSEFEAKVVFLPEACDYIATDITEARSLAESLNGPLLAEYKNLAKQYKLWLSIGGFHERLDETIYNSHILIDDCGEIKSIYRKIHLFDVTIPEKNIFLKESDLNTGGSQICLPINTPVGKLALSTCYDLRFPEQSILQTKMGAEILSYPSAFTKVTGEAHWEVLLRARAIENQCYVVAAAQYGKHNIKRVSFGQSMIVDPWGKILAACEKYTGGEEANESVAVAEINKDVLVKIRQEMPVFKHRRNDIYSLNLLREETNQIDDNETFHFADKVIPGSTVFCRSRYSYAFTNLRCVVPGHVLVSTLRVANKLMDLTKEEIEDLFQTTVRVQRTVEQEYKANSSTVTVQDGPFAGQTIPHVHVHILPRKQGDFQRNDDVYLQLAKHDRDDNPSPLRSGEEMAEEARRLRKYFL
ncbi:nitrilase and fragile histidine triad fusion protein NitFhit [Anoplophora glabripennis]|uniref:nitrilase and fragile histidine triad fusion protein NitFhit n=1 Tax=Anoplophora glabripennis TaxID=217634 RepID=UPI000873A640|nr:nitrilase and fragile histidine triad fusion protein NitFhit [Anoplophora glabripennis]